MYDRPVVAPDSLPRSRTDNPYWDIMRTIPGNRIDWKYDHVWSPDWTETRHSEKPIDRKDLCATYAWAIPDPDSLDFVAKWLAPKAVEIGAGTGYWSWQLTQLGIDMIAFDEKPPHICADNHFHSEYDRREKRWAGMTRDVYVPVYEGTPILLSEWPDRALFLCWPPHATSMAHEALTHYAGSRLVFIGEGEGGCTGDDAFFEKLSREWNEIATHRPVQWWAIHDWITVYERKEHAKT